MMAVIAMFYDIISWEAFSGRTDKTFVPTPYIGIASPYRATRPLTQFPMNQAPRSNTKQYSNLGKSLQWGV
jgi:hypothetical protein